MNSLPEPVNDLGTAINRESLDRRWQNVESIRQQLADELTKVAELTGGQEKQQLINWGRWFRGNIDLAQALDRPDILSIVVPILEHEPEHEITPSELLQAANRSFLLANANPSASRRLWMTIRYPMAVVAFLGLLWFCFVVFLAPLIRNLFQEFGIDLPLATRLAIGELPHLHTASWIILATVLLAFVTGWAINWCNRHRTPNSSWLDRRLMSTRHALGIWTWHVSVLMRAGLDSIEAIDVATIASNNHWIKRQSKKWLPTIRSNPSGTFAKEGLFSDSPFIMANGAFSLPDSQKKISQLQQVAMYYIDRARVVGDWWFRIVAWLILWNVLVSTAVTFIAIYGTLLTIMRGFLYWY